MVMDRLTDHMLHHNGNPHRGSHILAIEASEAYENARDRVVELSMPVNEKRLSLPVIVRNR